MVYGGFHNWGYTPKSSIHMAVEPEKGHLMILAIFVVLLDDRTILDVGVLVFDFQSYPYGGFLK